jgi:diguanylate cyclase (GGDEF)-like protein
MFARLAEASMSLDIGTLLVIAICVTVLLGLFLLFAWMQDRIEALAWWGSAYLVGGFSGTLWQLGSSVPLPPVIANVLLFVAVGMIWSAARLFHGRKVRWGAMCAGGLVWLGACLVPAFDHATAARIVLSSTIVATYTFLAAAELWSERRKSVIRRWPALFVPTLHGSIFLLPMVLASLGVSNLATGWVAVFAIEVVLYVVGAAFVVLVLAKDRAVARYKTAASTDPLTGLLNRRGFFEAAGKLMAGNAAKLDPVSVLAFDLDHFKSINDRHGHKTGDAILDLFARVARRTMRGDDVIGRIGGEEFVAIISGKIGEACIAAERVRAAFERAAQSLDSPQIPATVSIGVACGVPTASVDVLIMRADAALYRAKANGRNRVEPDEDMITPAAGRPGDARADVRTEARSGPRRLEPAPVLSVPILR